MKITKIVQQERVKDRYSIFIDGKYAFSLSEGALLDSHFAAGKELSKEELREWKQRASDDKIYSLALRYAALRPRSIWEVAAYLHRKGASPALAQSLVNKLSNIGLLHDETFAYSWVTNRRLLRPTSKRKLQQELRARHISDELIEQAINKEEIDERATLRQIAAKKSQLSKYRDNKLKLMQYLARQGFNYDDIKEVLGEIQSANDDIV